MRLSVETKSLHRHFGDKVAIEMIKKAGFDAFDMSYYHVPLTDPLMDDNFVAYAKELRAYADSLGIDCVQAHAPFDMQYGMAWDLSEPNYFSIIRAMESAAIMGAKCIVIHALKTYDYPEEDFVDYNYRYYKTFEPYCEKFGIKVAVENLFWRDKKRNTYKGVLGSPDELCAFIEKLDSPWFTACVDVGHTSLVGWEPEDFIRGMKKGMLTALHIQDNDYLGDRHIIPFMGKLNWPNIISALKEIGYEGELNFELQAFLACFPAPLRQDALVFEEKVGRYLISLAE